MIRVLFNPSCTSTFFDVALSMCVYLLIAPTSSEMRSDPASISRSNSPPTIIARSQPRTPPSACSGTCSASISSQAVSSPAPTRVGEISHPSSTPWSSIHMASSSSRSLTSSASSDDAVPVSRVTSCGSAATKERCSWVMGRFPSSAALSDASRKASRASAALRPMAAAGLFSSWARPAAMVPSEISFPCCCETDSSDASRTSDLPQVLVDELDGDCALADGRGAALDRAVTHVTSDEDAWHARLQKERVPIWPPALGTLTPLHQIRSREDKATFVALYDAIEPLRLRRSPDKDEERMGRRGLGLARPCVLRGYPFQVILTLDGDHSCVDQHLDIVHVFNLAHQVIGHALPQVAAPAEDKDSARLLGEEHRGLAGRVGPADDEYVLALARKSFRLGCAVVDAAPREMINTWHIQFPVGDACCDDQGVARDLRPVGEGHYAVRVLGAHRAHLLGCQDLYLETLRLVHGPPRQIAARKPGREAQIVLDAAAHSGLPARGLALYEDGLQAL